MTLNFIKYPSITNHYAIGKSTFLREQLDMDYVITEKIHGRNISLIMDNSGNWDIASRNGFFIESDKNIYNEAKGLIDPELIEKLKNIVDELYKNDHSFKQLILYGELFGSGIQKMDYDINKERKKDIKFFDMAEVFINPTGVFSIFQGYEDISNYGLDRWFVKVLGVGKLGDLILRDIENDMSQYGGYIEGYVYRPSGFYVHYKEDKSPIVKHKTERFAEIKQVKERKTIQGNMKFINLVESHFTMNRLNNILSHGDLELSLQNMRNIIIAMQEDVKKEIKDLVDEKDFAEVEQIIRKSGRLVPPLVKEKLLSEVANETD